MASFIFEDGDQLKASAFQSGDTLVFRNATAQSLAVTFTAATSSGTTSSPDIITLSDGTKTLQFAATALAGANDVFLNGGGKLVLGTGAADAALSVNSADISVAYAFDGNDTLTISGKGDSIVNMGAGDDVVNTLAGGVLSGGYTVQGGAGNDTINLGSATGNLHVFGNLAASQQGSADGADSIVVGHGYDSVAAVAGGAASMAAVAANDYVNGNAGNDTIVVSNTLINGTAGNAGDVHRLLGGQGDDSIVGSNFGYNSINGNLGNDTITSGGANDYLRGGQGNDVVTFTGAGNAQLFGDMGDDSLSATGTGITVMTGGAGNDVFNFGAGAAGVSHVTAPPAGTTDPLAGYVSEIKDFTTGSDHINLVGTSTGVGGVAANIILQQTGFTFTTEAAAQQYAQTQLTATTAPAGTHNIALIQVGSDTYLFSHEGAAAGTTIDTVIKLDGVTAANVKTTDFI